MESDCEDVSVNDIYRQQLQNYKKLMTEETYAKAKKVLDDNDKNGTSYQPSVLTDIRLALMSMSFEGIQYST